MSKTEQIGIVVRNKQINTIMVSVKRQFKHPLYSKMIAETKTYMVHDENNLANVGDTVLIKETRPLSARKYWLLKEIL
jgi:small subunit ribosomal protein S17